MSRISATEVEPKWAEMLRYLRFTPQDAGNIAAFGASLTPSFPSIIERFYDRIHEHEGAHAVLRDDAQVERLKSSLRHWLSNLFRGPYDSAYFARTEHVGLVHVRVNLPIRYMTTGISVLTQLLRDAMADRCENGVTAADAHKSVGKLLDAELAVMLDAYHAVLSRQHTAHSAAPGEILAHALDASRTTTLGLSQHGDVVFMHGPGRLVGLQSPVALDAVVDPEIARQMRERLEALRIGDRTETEFTTNTTASGGVARVCEWRIVKTSLSAGDVAYFAYCEDISGRSESEQKAREATRMATIGTLSAGLAHEIRNPLNGAHLHLKVLERALKQRPGDHELLETVGTVSHEIQRLGSLVTEFLQFARPQPLKQDVFVVCDVVSRAAALLEAEAKPHSIQVSFERPGSPAHVVGEPDKITQVLLNLGRNAIEAIGVGGNIWLSVKRSPKDVSIELADDGPGLSEPNAPIFDAFYSTKAHGTGLGLSICQRIVSDHNGTISVHSNDGRTTFRIRLPRITTHEAISE